MDLKLNLPSSSLAHNHTNGTSNGHSHAAGHHHPPSPLLRAKHLVDVNGHEPEGTRTPRPKTLTPSPPGSRRGSFTSMGIMRNGESEPEMSKLLRTIDFAARVSWSRVESRRRAESARNIAVSVARIWIRRPSEHSKIRCRERADYLVA